ncbi:MAG: hypothetical protein OXK80_03670 [Bdellovibrionales bacterium]|nr:hypothetical protein [Bdellovibrionales bacterium]
MKFLYLLLILCFVHCSSGIRFDTQSAEDRFADSLASEQESSATFHCNSEEDCAITETFLMDELETSVDIVFVLDVSSSMKNNLENLGSSMLDLLTHIQDFNWQMAFTTADHGDHTKSRGVVGEQSWESYRGNQPHFGKFMNLEYRGTLLNDKILNKHNNFYETVFYDTLTINEDNPHQLPPFYHGKYDGHSRDHEQPLRALKAAIERPENSDFFRPNSDLIAIIITNEDERSEDPRNATTAKEVVQTFQSQFSSDKNLYGFGILIQDQDKSCYRAQKRGSTAEYGNRVAELAKETDGVNIDICSSDYGKALESVSRMIRNRVLDNVYLTTAFPNASSVNVQITPSQNVDWAVKGRHIIFNPALEIGSEVQVTYMPR